MAGDLPRTGVELVADQAREFKNDMDDARNSVEQFGQAGMTGAGQIDAFGQIAIGALRQIGVEALNLAMDAGRQVIDVFEEMATGAMDAEVALAQMDITVGAMGDQTNVTTQGALALAEANRQLFGGSHETALAVEDMGVKLGVVSEETMPGYLKMVADMSAATGIDAVRAARLLGQAQEYPTSTVKMLRRYGIMLTTEQQKQVKQFEKLGKTEEAYAIITQAVTDRTAGAAEKMNQTTKGQLKLMAAEWSEGMEDAGKPLLPFIKKLTELLIPAIGDVTLAIAGFMSDPAVAAMMKWFTDLVTNLMGADPFMTKFKDFLAALGIDPATSAMIRDIVDSIGKLGGDIATTVGPFIDKFGKFIADLAAAQTPMILANLKGMMEGLGSFWDQYGTNIVAIADTIGRIAAITGLGAVTFLTGVADALARLLANDPEGMFAVLGNSLLNLAETMSGMDLGPGLAAWQGIWDNFKIIATTAWSQISDAFTGTINAIKKKIDEFITKIQEMIDKLKKAVIPDWLLHHSPSELELSFTGIDKALGHLVRGSLDQFSSGMSAMTLSPLVSPVMAGGGMMGGGSYDNSRQISVGNINNTSPLTAQIFDQQMRGWLNI